MENIFQSHLDIAIENEWYGLAAKIRDGGKHINNLKNIPSQPWVEYGDRWERECPQYPWKKDVITKKYLEKFKQEASKVSIESIKENIKKLNEGLY